MCPSQTSLVSYSMPEYYSGKTSYVGFFAIDPATGKQRRKRYKLDRIHNKHERKQYAQLLISSLLQKLMNGWNPWSSEEAISTRTPFSEVVQLYKKSIEHDGELGVLRPDSLKSYKSYLKVFEEYITFHRVLTYADEVTVGKVQGFLDYLLHEKKLSARTHNNYLVWLGVFCRWLMKHEYIKTIPTTEISSLKVDKSAKNRKTLDVTQLNALWKHLELTNKHYLLVCYLLFYCMIRPKEMSFLKIEHIHLKDGVIFVPGDVSKNRTGANVTLPKKVIHLMLDLNLFDYPSNYFIFSEDFAPGKTFRKCKPMSDYWDYHIRKDLKFGKDLKLYSLKDTGITTLLHKVDVLTVRDQARHSDISITNTYAQRNNSAVTSVQDWE